MTQPTDKRVGKRGNALRARSEASMIARVRVARLTRPLLRKVTPS